MKFSVIVVALNPGEKLKETIDSILTQTYKDYEIVVKDGGSKDGSVEGLPEDDRIRLYVEKDTGIYDAMNQAVTKAKGEFILFLNCGDTFFDERVLERAAACVEDNQGEQPLVVYGDTYGAKNDVMIAAPGKIDGFACYRNIPCHQSCFYEARLCKEKPYVPEYRIRADYDHFLWCFYKAGAKMVHMGGAVASYEGGGYSESKENLKRDKEEHRLITESYMEAKELAGYRRTMMLTLAPVRSILAENKLTSWAYHWLKDRIYHHKFSIILGLIFLVAELFLFLGTGVLKGEVVSSLTGADSWSETFSSEKTSFSQEFTPQYANLQTIKFIMNTEHMASKKGAVSVEVATDNEEILFQRNLEMSEIKNGGFTEVDVNLQLSPGENYYLTLESKTSESDEYPVVIVCGKEQGLGENKKLVNQEEMQGVQLVNGYVYADAVPFSKVVKVLFICILTSLGIMFGLPDNRMFRRIVAFVLMFIVPYVLGSRLELLSYNPAFYLPMSMKWNVLLMYAAEILVLLITHSPGLSVVLVGTVLTVLYSANYFTLMYRGTSLRLSDLTAIRTAAGVVDDYSLVPNSHMAMAWGLMVLFAVYAICAMGGQKAASKKGKLWIRGASYVFTIGLAAVIAVCGGRKLFYTDYLNDIGFADKEYNGVNYELIYSYNGFLVGSCVEIGNSRIVEPEQYSVEEAERLLENYAEQKEAEEDLPHIIMIMNESLADLQAVADVETNQDPMPFIHSLEENTIKGFANVSTIGGGTANSEFEVFTGCSMGFFPTNYYPYLHTLRQPSDSMISQMEMYGYRTIAMHPETGGNWNRSAVYKNLGFDQMLFGEDFAGAERIHHGVSDAETYNKIIELYEGRKQGEKLFVFDLTMQNHGGYNSSEEADAVVAADLNHSQLDEYLSLVKTSDAAFEELVAYFKDQDEKVIVCIFGDHQPWIFDDVVEQHVLPGADATDVFMNKYRTPFVIWANYDIREADGYDVSLNYFGGMVMKTAGIPLSPYFAYLDSLREEYPIITKNGYVDREGVYHQWSGEDTEFAEYRILQYNYLYDRNVVEWGY